MFQNGLYYKRLVMIPTLRRNKIMSYEKVKRITIKDGQVRVCSACNNLRPLTFSTWTYSSGDKTFDEVIKNLATDILDGNLQLYNSKQNERWLNATSLRGNLWDKYNEYLSASEYVYNDVTKHFEYFDAVKAKRLRNELIDEVANNIKLEFNL